jgi:glucan phosphoethanolaminetransferase (alkaline phosphatase superfamily)
MIQWNIGLLKNVHNATTNQVVKQITTIHIFYLFLHLSILSFVTVAILNIKTTCSQKKVNHAQIVVMFIMGTYIILLILLILLAVSLVQYVDTLVVHQEPGTLALVVVHGMLLGYVQTVVVIA